MILLLWQNFHLSNGNFIQIGIIWLFDELLMLFKTLSRRMVVLCRSTIKSETSIYLTPKLDCCQSKIEKSQSFLETIGLSSLTVCLISMFSMITFEFVSISQKLNISKRLNESNHFIMWAFRNEIHCHTTHTEF